MQIFIENKNMTERQMSSEHRTMVMRLSFTLQNKMYNSQRKTSFEPFSSMMANLPHQLCILYITLYFYKGGNVFLKSMKIMILFCDDRAADARTLYGRII